jgi:alkanesulfonate monooxygenase SsuD/methylene tetrahydromethanopterin reductase-like flavin-dependent oxidoreductase (luciferase family)
VPDHPSATTDCWTALAALAAVTGRVRLGPMVSCALYRPPWATARQAADVDRLSGGRLVLGLGAGWTAGEFAYLGLPFPPPAARHRVLRATIEEAARRWHGEPLRVAGAGAAMAFRGEALWWPPVQAPRVPLLMRDLRSDLLREPVETGRLRLLLQEQLSVPPIAQRIVSVIVGVPSGGLGPPPDAVGH